MLYLFNENITFYQARSFMFCDVCSLVNIELLRRTLLHCGTLNSNTHGIISVANPNAGL